MICSFSESFAKIRIAAKLTYYGCKFITVTGRNKQTRDVISDILRYSVAPASNDCFTVAHRLKNSKGAAALGKRDDYGDVS